MSCHSPPPPRYAFCKDSFDIVRDDDDGLSMATMWNRFKLPSLKSRSPQEVTEDVSHPSEVLASVREQHPNLSVFHNNDQRPESPAPPMPTPIEAKGSRRFTLLPKQRRDDGHESLRIHTPSPGPQSGILKKKSSPNMSGTGSSCCSCSGWANALLRFSPLPQPCIGAGSTALDVPRDDAKAVAGRAETVHRLWADHPQRPPPALTRYDTICGLSV